jgi:hypothetical protein
LRTRTLKADLKASLQQPVDGRRSCAGIHPADVGCVSRARPPDLRSVPGTRAGRAIKRLGELLTEHKADLPTSSLWKWQDPPEPWAFRMIDICVPSAYPASSTVAHALRTARTPAHGDAAPRGVVG